MTTPIRPTDDDARALAHRLIAAATHAALAVLDPATGDPHASRIALATAPEGTPLSLISALALHTAALRANPACSLLIGEPGPKGDPLTHPRLTLACTARLMPNTDARLRAHFLHRRPKAKLYVDLPDFAFALFDVRSASLNGGFGKAYRLRTADLGLPETRE